MVDARSHRSIDRSTDRCMPLTRPMPSMTIALLGRWDRCRVCGATAWMESPSAVRAIDLILSPERDDAAHPLLLTHHIPTTRNPAQKTGGEPAMFGPADDDRNHGGAPAQGGQQQHQQPPPPPAQETGPWVRKCVHECQPGPCPQRSRRRPLAWPSWPHSSPRTTISLTHATIHPSTDPVKISHMPRRGTWRCPSSRACT